LELGIGAGWNEPEYEEMGISYDATGIRVERLAESISIIKGLLSGETVRFRGKYYHVNHSVKPSPIQKPRPPIAMGGSGERLLSLAAREADIISFLGWRINRTGRSLRFKIFSPEVWRG
jgi:alkanesulfonate monooxygenase SsuD/methylene tetrahydromethanopterin reductase-like flavin-dependent oxidoreductase (luciferase family)